MKPYELNKCQDTGGTEMTAHYSYMLQIRVIST